jgi:diketogulonate reductase-like aldo/keto reductase
MQEVDKGDRQGSNMLYWLGIEYADLYLMHEGDLGGPGHHPSDFCKYPTTSDCRKKVFQSCLDWMKKNKTRACGVANWEVEWLQELVDAGMALPAVVQTKFHPHQSLSFGPIRAVKEFCDKHGILFNGYSPLGRADWTRFDASVGKPTLFEEPTVLDIAKRVNKTAAQVLLRWNVQQGIATQFRSMDKTHMQENLDVFAWKLSDADMKMLNSMPQCTTPGGPQHHTLTSGTPFMKGDPEALGHTNMIGPTEHC